MKSGRNIVVNIETIEWYVCINLEHCVYNIDEQFRSLYSVTRHLTESS